MKTKLLLLTILFTVIFKISLSQNSKWVNGIGPCGGVITGLAITHKGNMIATVWDMGVYTSTNNGISWTNRLYQTTSIAGFNCVALDSLDNVYVGTYYGSKVYKSSDEGVTWTGIGDALPSSEILSFTFGYPSTIYAGTSEGVYQTKDNGLVWNKISNWGDDSNINSVLRTSSGILLSGNSRGVYRSSDDGIHWNQTSSENHPLCFKLCKDGKIYSGGEKYFSRGGVYVSSDTGKSWIPTDTVLNNIEVQSIMIDSLNSIYIGTGYNGVFKSTDNGKNWVQISIGDNYSSVHSVENNNHGELFIGTSDGIFSTANQGIVWTQRNQGLKQLLCNSIYEFQKGILFVGTEYNGIYKSTDGGINWSASGLKGYEINIIIKSKNNTLFAGSRRLFRSTNLGLTWTTSDSGIIPTNDITALQVDKNGNLIAGTKNAGLFKSTNDGITWSNVELQQKFINCIKSDTMQNIYVGTVYGLYYLNNQDTVWQRIDPDNWTSIYVSTIELGDNNSIFVGCGSIFKSTDFGKNWKDCLVGPLSGVSTSIVKNNLGILVSGTSNYGVIQTNNNGDKWSDISTGLQSKQIKKVYFDSVGYLYALSNIGLSKSKNIITAMQGENTVSPLEYILEQNYPNPFNPTTNISFTLPSKSFVSLKIFDALGRAVSTLVNEELSAGNQTRQWNAGNVSSGIYFYQLKAGSFTETKKLLLLR